MKKMILSLVIAMPAVSFATTVDCSSAASGEVRISAVGNRLTHQEAAEAAFKCLSQQNTAVKKEIQKAQAKAKSNEPSYASSCGGLGQAQIVEIASWNAGRPSHNGEMGGESTQLAIQPIICDGVGTGLYSGTVGNATFKLDVQESLANVFSDDSLQQIKVTLTGVAGISSK
ncbi:hypothetical protein [Bdellovibrio sp. HCB209]|uniref:hypothetical protein n=1 Tax=Bdellovibrio sp. HCB209 TaxID=3394354 RepID=UPI0039B65025